MKLNVVLVRTEHPANIGATARAMDNMGADRLILIDPRCSIDAEARAVSTNAEHKLRETVTYTSWKEFFASEPDGIRLALSRRGGRKRKIFSLKEKLGELLSPPPVLYLIFGPESDGLDSDDLAYAHFVVHLPVFSENGSLNLAQAALLALFMLREKYPIAAPQVKGETVEAVQPFYFPDDLIKDWLIAMGFDVNARRASAYLTLRRLFLQNLPTRHEIQVLEAILQQNIRKLNERNLVGLAAKELADDLTDIALKEI